MLHTINSLDTSRLPASRHLKDKVLPNVEFVIVEGATHTGPQGLFVARLWRLSRRSWSVILALFKRSFIDRPDRRWT